MCQSPKFWFPKNLVLLGLIEAADPRLFPFFSAGVAIHRPRNYANHRRFYPVRARHAVSSQPVPPVPHSSLYEPIDFGAAADLVQVRVGRLAASGPGVRRRHRATGSGSMCWGVRRSDRLPPRGSSTGLSSVDHTKNPEPSSPGFVSDQQFRTGGPRRTRECPGCATLLRVSEVDVEAAHRTQRVNIRLASEGL